MKIKLKIKRKYYIIVNVLLVFFLTFVFYLSYTSKTSDELEQITDTYYKKNIYDKLNIAINEAIEKTDIDNLLYLYKNNSDEILYVDYNLKKSYAVQKSVKEYILSSLDENFDIKFPFLVGSKNIFLNNYGPKITVRINYVNSLLTNIYTKVTNYGLNNALLEVYIKINVEGQIITPITEKKEVLSYDMLLSSKVINGRVPSFYGSSFSKESGILNIQD